MGLCRDDRPRSSVYSHQTPQISTDVKNPHEKPSLVKRTEARLAGGTREPVQTSVISRKIRVTGVLYPRHTTSDFIKTPAVATAPSFLKRARSNFGVGLKYTARRLLLKSFLSSLALSVFYNLKPIFQIRFDKIIVV